MEINQLKRFSNSRLNLQKGLIDDLQKSKNYQNNKQVSSKNFNKKINENNNSIGVNNNYNKNLLKSNVNTSKNLIKPEKLNLEKLIDSIPRIDAIDNKGQLSDKSRLILQNKEGIKTLQNCTNQKNNLRNTIENQSSKLIDNFKLLNDQSTLNMNETMRSDQFINQQIKKNDLNINFDKEMILNKPNQQSRIGHNFIKLDNNLKNLNLNKTKQNNQKISKSTDSIQDFRENSRQLKKDDKLYINKHNINNLKNNIEHEEYSKIIQKIKDIHSNQHKSAIKIKQNDFNDKAINYDVKLNQNILEDKNDNLTKIKNIDEQQKNSITSNNLKLDKIINKLEMFNQNKLKVNQITYNSNKNLLQSQVNHYKNLLINNNPDQDFNENADYSQINDMDTSINSNEDQIPSTIIDPPKLNLDKVKRTIIVKNSPLNTDRSNN